MPYKDKETAKEKSKERMRKMRTGVTKKEEMLHPDVTPDVHPIIHMLAEESKRLRLRTICKSLKPWMFNELYVGVPGHGGVPFSKVAELLTAFEDEPRRKK